MAEEASYYSLSEIFRCL